MGEYSEERGNRWWQDEGSGLGPEPTQQGGTEEDSADNLADHRRLSQAEDVS